jgi:hypothetical protein
MSTPSRTLSVVTLLAKQSPSRLLAMQAEAREKKASLQAEEELITRALAEQGQSTGPVSNKSKLPSDSHSNREKREIFREILSTRPDHAWMPAEMRLELSKRKIESTNDAIRALLRRMAKDGEVIRGDDGTGWRLASTNGSHQE